MTEFIHQLRWHARIGDPGFMGWFTVVAYAVAALTSWLAARRAGNAPGLAPGSRMMWLLVTVLMVFLCINKQLDLQSLFTDIGRVLSKQEGWYAERRVFQKWFVLAILFGAVVFTVFSVIRFRMFWRTHFVLGLGLTFLLTFIVVRAVSFHHVEMVLDSRIFGAKMNWVFELTGIALIWLASLRDYSDPKRMPKPPWKPAM